MKPTNKPKHIDINELKNDNRSYKSRSRSMSPHSNVAPQASNINRVSTQFDNNLELEDLEKRINEEAQQTLIMPYRDFYEIDYQEIYNFHKKV